MTVPVGYPDNYKAVIRLLEIADELWQQASQYEWSGTVSPLIGLAYDNSLYVIEREAYSAACSLSTTHPNESDWFVMRGDVRKSRSKTLREAIEIMQSEMDR